MKTWKGVPTAWEALTGRAEGVGSLRRFGKRFGERCILQVPRETRKKADFIEMKGEPGVFQGQSEGISGWIVMMDKDGSITHSRDIPMHSHQHRQTDRQRNDLHLDCRSSSLGRLRVMRTRLRVMRTTS